MDTRQTDPKSLIPVIAAPSPATRLTLAAGSPGFQQRMVLSLAARISPLCQCKVLHGKGSTSRPEDSVLAVLAPKNGDQCCKRRLFDWNAAGLRVLFREVKASSTSMWRSSPLWPERFAQPRRSKFSTDSAWKSTCCNNIPRKACLSLEILSQVNMAFTTASSRETPKSSLFTIRASWLAVSFPKSGRWLQVSKSSATFSSHAALRERKPCASWRTCRATLPSKEAMMPASIDFANFGKS